MSDPKIDAPAEVRLSANGKEYRLLLTLGALAEIEDGLGIDSVGDMPARLARVRAADLAIIAAALMRGGGHELTPADVLRLPCGLHDLRAAIMRALEMLPGDMSGAA